MSYYSYIERKWLLTRNLATVLPLKSKLSGTFQHFNAIDGVSKCWQIVKFPKISIKMKNCKTFYETQTAATLRKLFRLPANPPHQIKSYYVFGTNIFWRRYTEIYGYLLAKCFKNAVIERQVQCKCFLWHQTETCLLENL